MKIVCLEVDRLAGKLKTKPDKLLTFIADKTVNLSPWLRNQAAAYHFFLVSSGLCLQIFMRINLFDRGQHRPTSFNELLTNIGKSNIEMLGMFPPRACYVVSLKVSYVFFLLWEISRHPFSIIKTTLTDLVTSMILIKLWWIEFKCMTLIVSNVMEAVPPSSFSVYLHC